MAQDLNAIIQELDASYNPSRQSINDRINSLQGAEQADMQGLQGTQTQAFGDIVNNAQERGVAFGGVPLGEQAKYTSTQFLPAVAKLKSNYVQARGGLSDALNSLNLDQNKTALSIREAQQGRDFQAQQAELQRQAEARARSAADSSSNALSSLLSGGGGTAKNDPYAALGNQKQQATNAMVGLLNTNNPATIQNTIKAIEASAAKGNVYDKYKLELLNNYKQTSYGDIISKALSYKPGVISLPTPGKSNVTITFPGSNVNQHPNIAVR